MTATPTKSAPIRRRWLQVSLRTLLVLMLFVAIGFGWLGMILQHGREQRRAVLAISELGGQVLFNEPSTYLQRSSWLTSVLGEDSLLDVDRVKLSRPSVTDAGLVQLKGLAQLRYLDLHNTQVSDAGLVHLKGLKQLDWLDLNETQVTDAGLVHLSELTQLEGLHLSNTKVTDAGVQQLQTALPHCAIFR